MLDFAEVSRRLGQHRESEPERVTHEYIVSPLIGQLLDPEYHGENGVLITPHECANLAQMLQRQAQLLDEAETCVNEGLAVCEGLLIKLKRLKAMVFVALVTLVYTMITVAVAWLI